MMDDKIMSEMNDKMTTQRQTSVSSRPWEAALRCLAVAPVVGLLLLLLAASGLASAPADEATTTLTLQPPSRMIAVGETVTTEVRVEDVDSLYTFEFRLSFNPTVIEGVQVEPGGFLSPDWQLEKTIDNDEGRICYALSQLNPAEPVTGTGALAIITWRGLAEGTSPVSFTHVSLYARGGVAIPVTSEDGQITVGEGQAPPTIANLNPESTLGGSPAFSLTVSGTNFVTESVVHWDGSPRTTTFVSATRLTADIGEEDVSAAGTFDVRVVNPLDQGGTSAAATFTVTNPAPVVTSLSPFTTTIGGPAFTLTVEGGGFVESSTVRWNGSDRLTTFISTTQLTVTIPTGDISEPGTADVSVVNPGPGGGTSSELPFQIVEVGPASPTDFIFLPLVSRGGS
jgi:hypothetical protein